MLSFKSLGQNHVCIYIYIYVAISLLLVFVEHPQWGPFKRAFYVQCRKHDPKDIPHKLRILKAQRWTQVGIYQEATIISGETKIKTPILRDLFEKLAPQPKENNIHLAGSNEFGDIWVWVKMKAPGDRRLESLVFLCQASILGTHFSWAPGAL